MEKGNGKKRNKSYWNKLNYYRWRFLSCSSPYKDLYKQSLSSNNFVELAYQCLIRFNLYLTENYFKQKRLPDPNISTPEKIKELIKQTGQFYFYDYYFHITGKSLLMEEAFGSTKACLHIRPVNKTKEKKKQEAYKQWAHRIHSLSRCSELSVIQGKSGKRGFFVFGNRIIPGIKLFAIDSNLPIPEAIECFKREYSQLAEEQKRGSEAYTNLNCYYLPKKRKQQRFEDWDHYLKAYHIYEFCYNAKDKQILEEEVFTETRESFKKENYESLLKLYEQKYKRKKVKTSFEKWYIRTFYEWVHNAKELIELASSGCFIQPD